MTAVDLEISLRPAGSHFAVEARCNLPGSDVMPHTGATVEMDHARLQALTLDSVAYGLALGQMVLVGDIATTFAKASAVAQDRGLPLRLRLAIPDDLQALRWEMLRNPTHPDAPLLSTGAQVLFSRYLGSADWQQLKLRSKGKLRALAVLASLSDLSDYSLHPLDLRTEQTLVETSFGSIPVTMLAQGQASLNEIIQHLHEGYDILYLLAHGRTDDAGETWLYLESADGRTVPVQGSALVTRIAELRKRPQLIVLGSCESAGALLALGLRLAQAGVPAVLGMQGRITLETLHTFLPSTLRALQRDGLIDQAVAIGRGVVRERPDFWAPVLFLRSRSGLLWLPSGAELETSEELLERMSTDEVPDEIAHKPTNNQVSIQISGEINVDGSDNSVYYNHSQHRLESVVVVTLQDTMAPINFNSVTEALAPDKPFGTPIFIRPIVGNLPWEAAAEHQHQVITEIIQRIRDLKISHFAVFSFAQIPLAIHLGFLLSDRIEVRCFQYDRERFSWSWPNIDPELADTNIQVTGIPTQFIEEETYVVIRVSLSARINPYDTNNVVGDSMLTIDIFVDNPDVMWLRHPSQLDHLAQVFRRTLASVRANVVHCSRIHLFYAGPTGGAVVIGQQINPRMNPPVELYHFSFQMTPRYQWVLTLTEAIS